ncbi:MAG: hypothetical protein PHI27_13800 [Eubacteriales bacterium]|nr:hypothetical protein [Eubacteriales bacterium]MDD3883297.1 hypothetical protein [Eubacteriales bacterium]MDD4512085.1 hypothetical protein [Eubacteriales bacterium]
MREITITVNSAGKLTASNTTLGYAGEHLAVKVNFDVSAWAEVFPGAEIDNVSVLATINNARGYALVESKPQDGIVTWLPSAADMVASRNGARSGNTASRRIGLTLRNHAMSFPRVWRVR